MTPPDAVSLATVRLTGRIALDDVGHLLAELAKETALEWREEHPPDDKHLSGIEEILLTAVISGVAGKGAELTVDRVREVVSRWRNRRLDPPEAEVEVRTVLVEQSAADTQAPKAE